MLDSELHLVSLGEKSHHSGLMGGVSNVSVIDFQNAVAHAELSRAGCSTTRDDLIKDMLVSAHLGHP